MTFGIFERQHFLQSQGSQHSVLETFLHAEQAPETGQSLETSFLLGYDNHASRQDRYFHLG